MDAQLTIVDVTGSTNDDLLEAGKQGAPHGTGLAARAQTAGRGRRGHKWDSTAGNLLLSIVLRPRVDPAKYSGLAAVSGLAVLEALEKQGLANEIGLKWPNDLVARGRKLGGILVEAARDNEGSPFRRLRHWRQCELCALGGSRWRPGGNRPLGSQRERSRRRCAAQGGLLHRRKRCGRVGRAVSTPWKKTPDRSRPSTANMSLTSIGLGSTLSPVPLPVTSWHAASLKPSMPLVARVSKRKAACDPSILRRHRCVL